MSHPNIDTRQISCPLRAARALATSPAPLPLPPGLASGPRRNLGHGLICSHSVLPPEPGPNHPGQDKGKVRKQPHVSSPDPLLASRWPQQQNPQQQNLSIVQSFLKTAPNCSGWREKQMDSAGIHQVHHRRSKKPVNVQTYRFFNNGCLPGKGENTALTQ